MERNKVAVYRDVNEFSIIIEARNESLSEGKSVSEEVTNERE